MVVPISGQITTKMPSETLAGLSAGDEPGGLVGFPLHSPSPSPSGTEAGQDAADAGQADVTTEFAAEEEEEIDESAAPAPIA